MNERPWFVLNNFVLFVLPYEREKYDNKGVINSMKEDVKRERSDGQRGKKLKKYFDTFSEVLVMRYKTIQNFDFYIKE